VTDNITPHWASIGSSTDSLGVVWRWNSCHFCCVLIPLSGGSVQLSLTKGILNLVWLEFVGTLLRPHALSGGSVKLYQTYYYLLVF
jgi:hypothetical protein